MSRCYRRPLPLTVGSLATPGRCLANSDGNHSRALIPSRPPRGWLVADSKETDSRLVRRVWRADGLNESPSHPGAILASVDRGTTLRHPTGVVAPFHVLGSMLRSVASGPLPGKSDTHH